MSNTQIIQNKILSAACLKKEVRRWKSENKKIVFTNGCFDILHVGHVDYLSKAAELGNLLIIGLNSDSSVRRIKGEKRPINEEQSRAFLLASLFFVDAVVVFEEDTPIELIKTIMPDILVKGNDYSEDEIVGSKEVKANGGKIVTFELVKGFSTTAIENKIKNAPI
ncbi:MAG: D-glycero-beta-D-manno-heptose 1-phosphate adenylyltransferase [Bacteroidales bacterium]|nr:D-glycero-beta-D-manno-heptose 1-phosphate adenylyltransferase [Bacteroidales bacterium]